MQVESRMLRRKSPGVIDANQAYTLREFLRRTDLGDHAWRQVRRRLRLRRVGQKIFVLGRDWIDYLDKLALD